VPDPHPLAWLDAHAATRRDAGLRRVLRPRAADEPLLDLAGNDYLGLSTDPRVVEGACTYDLTIGGQPAGQLPIHFVITENGQGIKGLPTTSGFAITCDLKAQ